MRNFAHVKLFALLLGTTSTAALAGHESDLQTTKPTNTQQASTVTQDSPAPLATPDEQDAQSRSIIVTGSRTPRAVDKIAGAVTVITSADVQRSLALTEDSTAVLAKTVPGYSESSQTLNTLGETMRGRVALYLFDGIPQSTPLRNGSRNAAFTDMSTIERIEVIGGASASEGIGAEGGVINYISRRATQPGLHVNLGGRLGTQFRDDSGIWGIKGDVAYKGSGVDFFAAGAYVDRGITYDANGRRIGMSASSSLSDSVQKNLFVKVGTDFGAGDTQRLELTANWFRLKGKANYHWVAGDRALGIPDTAEPGPQLIDGVDVLRPDFNDFKQTALKYSNEDVFGGTLITTVYAARQAMRFPGDNGASRQDPQIAPLGTLVDQSEVLSKKYGLLTSFSRPDFLIDDLLLRIGVDAVHDQTQQRLALTDRVWVPPMNYDSIGPYIQMSWDIGPVTLSGGARHENGQVQVDDYVTTFFRNSVAVEGGKLKYSNTLPNVGLVTRLGAGFSVFGSYSKGFTLPNLGIPLRNINTPGQSVEGIVDLKAVIFDNKEIGANWRGRRGSVGVSAYRSFSKLGSSLAVDPVTQDFVLNRRPVRITGIDATAELRATDWFRFNGVYSHVKGRTTSGNNVLTPVETPLGITNIPLDKLVVSGTFTPTDALSFTIGMDTTFDRAQAGSSPPEDIEGRTLFDLTAKYRIENAGTVTLGVENLFNEFYFLAFSQIDFFQNYFAGRGRTVSLQFRTDF
ncbi:MAG: TonB-dependent receptor [Alphaproteobacteria bacterium HGW-Alphaproteobacteria-7]|jgi:iron complex outermembrane receptor protein|nr:MAG: TonB-dependent receptor [Alphaproteobacteria bacterium HGW-Alphaproteobacteria-7]